MARWARLTAAIVITILALAGIARLIPDTAPASDFALIETHVLHVLRGWQPVGVYSRVGGHHPGPLYFQVLAPLYLLSGYRHLGVVLTVAALNVGALIALLLILKRHGTNSAILIAAAVVFGIFLVRVEGLLASIWNPHVGIVPLGLLVVAAAAAANGAYRLIPVVVVLASFVIQTHFAFLVPAMTVIVASAILIALRLSGPNGADARRTRSYARPLVIAGVLGALLWAMPLIDEFSPSGHHNLQRTYSFFQSREPHNLRMASRAFEHLFVAPLTPGLLLWDTPLPGRSEVRSIVWIQTALLIAAVVIARLRRQRFEMNLGLLVIAASVVALFAMRRIPERIEVHTVLWVTVLGVLSWSVILAVLLSAVVDRIRRPEGLRLRMRAPIIATSVLAIVVCVRGMADRRAEDMEDSRLVAGVTSLVRTRLAEVGDRHPHIRVPPAFWGLATGVVHQLYRGDIRPSVDADRVGMFGRPFAPAGRERITIQFAQEDEHAKDLSKRSDYRLLGKIDDFYVYSVEPLMPRSRN